MQLLHEALGRWAGIVVPLYHAPGEMAASSRETSRIEFRKLMARLDLPLDPSDIADLPRQHKVRAKLQVDYSAQKILHDND